MKRVFAECYKAVSLCEDETGRRRWELFKELPDKKVRIDLNDQISIGKGSLIMLL